MSDTAPKDQDALVSGHVARTKDRTPRVGESLWRVTKEAHVLTCELRRVARVGWELVVREDGELSFSRWCETEGLARARAAALRRDHLRTGWTDAASAATLAQS